MTRLDRIAALARHTVVYAVGDMLGRAMGVILVPLYARALSPEENGVISLGFAFLGFSAVVYSLGINPALIRVLSTSDPDRQSAPFSSAFWTLLGLGGVLSSLLYGFAEPVSVLVFGSAGRAGVFRLIAGVIFLDTLSEPLFTLCRARQRSRFFAGVRAAQHTLQLGLTVVLIAGMNGGPEAVFQANLVSSALALILLLPAARRTFSWTLRADLLRDLLAFGLPFVPSALALLVINLSDRFMVKAFLGLEALGVYGIAFKLGLPMLFVVRAFRSAWAPALLRIAERADAREVCARVATYFLAGAVFLVLILATYARECIILIAGDRSEDYLIGHPVIPLVALGFLFYGLYIVLTAGVYAEGKTARLPLVGGAGAAANVGLNLILLPRIGIVAAAWSSLAAYAVMAALLYLMVRRIYPVAFELGRMFKIAAAGGVVFLTVSRYLPDASYEGIIARGIFLMGYPIILWGWRLFDAREWAALRSALGFPAHHPH